MGHEQQSAKIFDFYLCPGRIKFDIPKISAKWLALENRLYALRCVQVYCF